MPEASPLNSQLSTQESPSLFVGAKLHLFYETAKL